MANVLYPKFKDAILKGLANVDVTSGASPLKAIVVDTADYTYAGTHEFLSSVGAPSRVATSAALANVTVADGTVDCDPVTINGVTGDQSEAVVLFLDTGNEATSRLVAYFDSVSGFPFTPNGGSLTLTPHASGLFKI